MEIDKKRKIPECFSVSFSVSICEERTHEDRARHGNLGSFILIGWLANELQVLVCLYC